MGKASDNAREFSVWIASMGLCFEVVWQEASGEERSSRERTPKLLNGYTTASAANPPVLSRARGDESTPRGPLCGRHVGRHVLLKAEIAYRRRQDTPGVARCAARQGNVLGSR